MKTLTQEQFGKDHWSLLAYIETCCVDNKGRIDLTRVRCNPKTHPGLAEARMSSRTWEPTYGTILRGGTRLDKHDDHDCADDLEQAGLIRHIGTGINPVFQMTTEGQRVVSLLRQHKSAGKQFSEFVCPLALQETL